MDIVLASKEYDLRLALEVLLREEPGVYVVGVVSSTQGLLALVETMSPDVVLLDGNLPGRPLAEVLAQVQRVEPSPKIVVLAPAARAGEAALAAGAHAFVIKGDPPEQVLAAVRGFRRDS